MADSDIEEVDQLISEDEYEVEAIVNHRKRGSLIEYYVKWKDYDDDSNTWEPAENLADAQKLVDQYFESIKAAKKTRKRTRTPKLKRTISYDSSSSHSGDNINESSTVNGKGGSANNMNQIPTSNAKKTKIILPTNGLSTASKKAKATGGGDEDFIDVDSDTKKLKQVSLDDDDVNGNYDDGLDRIAYNLENEDGESEKIAVIVDEKYPSGNIDWDSNIDRVVVVIGKNDSDRSNDTAILKWYNGKYSLHSVNDIRKSCPQHLIDYYQRYLLF